MVRAEPQTTCTVERNISYPTRFTVIANVTNSALYVDKVAYGSNGKIATAELLQLVAK